MFQFCVFVCPSVDWHLIIVQFDDCRCFSPAPASDSRACPNPSSTTARDDDFEVVHDSMPGRPPIESRVGNFAKGIHDGVDWEIP